MKNMLLYAIRMGGWLAPAGLLLFVLSCRKVAGPAGSGGLYSDPKSLNSLINANFDLSHFDTAMQITGIDSTLAGKGPFTVFVVPDDAYPTIGNSFFGNVTYYSGGSFYARSYSGVSNYYYSYVQNGVLSYLKRVTQYHILPMNLRVGDIPFALNTGYPTLAGDSVYISKYIDPNSATPDTVVTVNGIKLLRSDFTASNGTYHVLTQLLFPAPNESIWAILSGSNALGWSFEPTHNETTLPYGNEPPAVDTDGFSIPRYQYGLFTTALVRTGLSELLQQPGAYTVLAVPDTDFVNAYSTRFQNFTLDDIRNMNLDTLTRLMKQHILKGRYFLNDFYSYPYNPLLTDTVYNPAFGQYTYNAPLAFPTIGGDTLYVIPKGVPLGGTGTGLWLFGTGNLTYSPYTSLYQNKFAALGTPDFEAGLFTQGLYGKLLPQDLVAPNGVIQFLSNNEIVPR